MVLCYVYCAVNTRPLLFIIAQCVCQKTLRLGKSQTWTHNQNAFLHRPFHLCYFKHIYAALWSYLSMCKSWSLMWQKQKSLQAFFSLRPYPICTSLILCKSPLLALGRSFFALWHDPQKSDVYVLMLLARGSFFL
jgi:hypothetical protein